MKMEALILLLALASGYVGAYVEEFLKPEPCAAWEIRMDAQMEAAGARPMQRTVAADGAMFVWVEKETGDGLTYAVTWDAESANGLVDDYEFVQVQRCIAPNGLESRILFKHVEKGASEESAAK